MGVPPRRDWRWALRWFFGVIARRQTWLNAVYLVVAFPLGLLYFVFTVVGMSIGLSLAILWVGIPVLLIVVGAWWGFAALERQLARYLRSLDCGISPRPWESETGALSRLRAHLTHPSTWRGLVFVLVKLPLGAVSCVLVAGVGVITQALLFAPLWALSAETEGVDRITLWNIDTPWEAIPVIPLSLLALIMGLHLMNGLAALWRVLAEALLLEPYRQAPALYEPPPPPLYEPAPPAPPVSHPWPGAEPSRGVPATPGMSATIVPDAGMPARPQDPNATPAVSGSEAVGAAAPAATPAAPPPAPASSAEEAQR